MDKETRADIAIVDYGLGNLFSVRNAFTHVGLNAIITSKSAEIEAANAVMLPGVGAFGDAMDSLERLGLTELLKDVAASGKPFIGICLGLQLLFTESREFGSHKGLGIIEGEVVRFEDAPAQSRGSRHLKVPHVGWSRINKPKGNKEHWDNGPLSELTDGEYMYFVHSYFVRPSEENVVLSTSNYGDVEFCSSISRGNIFACQFHPERSGPPGLGIYLRLANMIRENIFIKEKTCVG